MALPYKGSQVLGSAIENAFEWRFEFPEVLDDDSDYIGFDVVVGNPPYGLINKRQNKTSGISTINEELTYYKSADEYAPAQGGMLNIFRLFVVKSTAILKSGGFFSQIFPLAFAGDESAGKLRAYFLENTSLRSIEAFPERDNEKKRVFEAVKMSVCILNFTKEIADDNQFFLRIHHDRFIGEQSEKVKLAAKDVSLLDNKNFTIPLLQPSDLALLKKVYMQSVRISDIGHCYTGEIDMTLDRKYISSSSSDAVMIKGAILDRYIVREKMSQGQVEYLNSSLYKGANSQGKKATHHQSSRIVMQGITGVNEARRLKMTLAESGVFCANSVNYIIFGNSKFQHKFVLGLLNSSLLNFVFSKSSTNSNVNGYEVDNLPIRNLNFSDPADKQKHDAVVGLVETMLSLHEQKAATTDPSERARLEREIAETDAQIDRLVYGLYELTEEEIRIVEEAVAR